MSTPADPSTAGAWITYSRCNCYDKRITGVYATELDALRVANDQEFMFAEFWPYGCNDTVSGYNTQAEAASDGS